MPRPDWDTYFLSIAAVVATRATCPRRSVGAVLVDTRHRIVATGYNGAPSHLDQCDEVGCLMRDRHCVRALHAEANAMDYAHGDCSGTTLYIHGGTPCMGCANRIVGKGIYRVVTMGWYPDMEAVDLLRSAAIALDMRK